MTNQKTLPYHLQFIALSNDEIRKVESLESQDQMTKLLKRCASNNEVSLENLHEHLRIAMMLELSTIPPYLCALYSIESGDKNDKDYQSIYGDNAEAAYLIRSVMMEEMLHFTLAGNILNAVKGRIEINKKKYVPQYPTILPDSAGKFVVHLSKLDRSALKTFLRIEQPTPADTEPKLNDYDTIGQFYNAIIQLMKALEEEAIEKGDTIFNGDEALQIEAKYYYGGGGKIIHVNDLESAINAITIILEQGEGSEHSIYDTDEEEFDQINELAHFFKFNEIYEAQRYASCQRNPKEPPQGTKMSIKYNKVYNMGIDPKTKDFVSKDLMDLSNEFNQLYMELLGDLQKAFTGHSDQFLEAVCNMYKLRYKAVELMRNPIPGKKFNAGPSFEFVD